MRTSAALRRAALATAVVVAPLAAVTAPAAHADAGPIPSFYDTPADLTTVAPGDGDVVRAEPTPVALTSPSQGLPWQSDDARRILFRSTGAAGGPVAVSGLFLRSTAAAPAGGARPLAVVAPGTMGQGRQCAPSLAAATAVGVQPNPPSVSADYELASAAVMLSRGFDVVLTDYEGLGTAGVHPYVDRFSEGQTVLDAARAALRLPGTDLSPASKVVVTGYSQGGGAAAAAAELASTYAPELDIVGVSAGAPPADLLATLEQVDGGSIAGVALYAINGFTASHPELLPLVDARLNANGLAQLATARDQCIGDTALTFGFHRTSELTLDGRSLADNIREIPEVMALVERERIGTARPAMPVRVEASLNDDTVPYGQARQMADEWCALGGTVDMVTDTTPAILPGAGINHMVPFVTRATEAADYLAARAAGAPAPTTCGTGA